MYSTTTLNTLYDPESVGGYHDGSGTKSAPTTPGFTGRAEKMGVPASLTPSHDTAPSRSNSAPIAYETAPSYGFASVPESPKGEAEEHHKLYGA